LSSCDRDGDEEEHEDDDRDAAGLFTLVGGYPSSAPAYERLLSSRGPPSSSSRMLSSRRANRGGGGATGAGTNSRGNGTAATTISSLDLELGEASIWDRRVAGFGVPRDDDSDVDDEDEDASGGDDDVGQAAGAVDAQRRFAGGAPVEDLSGLFARPGSEEGMARSRRRRRRSAVELLAQFDPQRPPESDDPIDLQLWLECEAQQEAVLRYQKLIDQARERGDYGSLSIVQRQILRWYPSLLSEISDRQRDYVLKRTDARHYRSAKRYGPYLCALPAEKMAVIAAHESILYCLIKSGLHGKEGVPFVGLAHRLGAAVEEEVVVHRALHKRWIESSKRRQQQEDADEEGTVRDLLPQEFDEGSSVEADEESDDEESTDDDEEEGEGGLSSTSSNFAHVTHQWSYAASHLKTFLDEINQRQPTAKKRRVIAYAIRRARQILEKEAEWTTEEKVHLGAALFQIILEKATVSYDGKEEMAFTYEKRWYHSLNKLKSFVKLNERLYDMVVSDKLQSFHATTTRFKPTIIPPKPWRGVNNGAYLWLRADLMRFHGCKMQKVRSAHGVASATRAWNWHSHVFCLPQEALMNADLSTVYDGLNALGRVPWKINRRVLAVAQRCWDDNIPLGDVGIPCILEPLSVLNPS
jgi:DNA-directed RNA polymerase